MSSLPRLKWVCGAVLLAMALAGCHNGNNNDDDTPSSSTTANDLAVQQIRTMTCETKLPQDINTLTITDSDAAVDVALVDPGCT